MSNRQDLQLLIHTDTDIFYVLPIQTSICLGD